MDASTDFEAVVDRIRTQSSDASGSDTDRVTIRSYDAVDIDTLRDLLEVLEAESAGSTGSSAPEFFLSSENVARVLENGPVDDHAALEERLGRPVTVVEGMPTDAIVYAVPDAIEGDELLEPSAVACALVGKAR